MKPLDNHATAARFLLGGIGTGTISLDQNARLCDYEIWNLPNKGNRMPYNFFAVRTESEDGEVNIKALESELVPPFDRPSGYFAWECGGIPRFKHSQMTGDYPFVNYVLSDDNMPVEAHLEAYTPFIPLATDDSSRPAAILKYTIYNKTDKDLAVSVAGSMPNLSGYKRDDLAVSPFGPIFERCGQNIYVDNELYRGIHFTAGEKTEADRTYFESALVTTEQENVSYLDQWETAWWDGLQDFWNDFSADGQLTNGRNDAGENAHIVSDDSFGVASLCVKKTIPAHASADFTFIYAWYYPNRVRHWYQRTEISEQSPMIRNYYAKFGTPLVMLDELVPRLPYLEKMSRQFAKAMRDSSVPEYVADAILSTVTVIRSNTCWRVEDGTFFAWEGNFDLEGSCAGNCTHVWGYTQMMAFLFPELERSMRETEFLTETDPDGRMYFRAHQYLDHEKQGFHPAADGQLDTITRLYRDWKLCGDDAFIRKIWPNAKKALDYACIHWDTDGDGVLDGEQHNTYDIEFMGQSSMINSIYYAALKCGQEISSYLGDEESAQHYAELAKKGAEKLDALTFNGEYYIQNIEDLNARKYQYGTGCLADQLLGQQLAHVNHLGYVLPEEHVKSAVRSIYKYNFRENFSDVLNLQRTYTLNDDAGLLLCTWPNGGRPLFPFVYSDEVWTGIEYQVATHLIYEGYLEEGLRIVQAVRERHDGVKRSPWNEVECGYHYARSLSSYGVLLALSGFFCDAVNKTLYFNPAIDQDDFQCFFCCNDGWGIFRQKKQEGSDVAERSIETLYGDLSGYTIA